MHVLFVHDNFPGQFGHIAATLAARPGWTVTFATASPGGDVAGIHRIVYQALSGATEATHFCARTFENQIWTCDAAYQALKARPDIKPDLIVGHSGFGSTLFLRELYGATPILNLFEFYYHVAGPDCDMTFRQDLGWPISDAQLHRARSRNAMILLDLQHCDAGYVPTQFQRSRFPEEYAGKLQVMFDGVDRTLYHGYQDALRRPLSAGHTREVAGLTLGPETRLVTYVSRGFESLRGFDIFMKTAQRILAEFSDVRFVVVGSDRVCYGGDTSYLEGQASFKDWVLAQDTYDLSKFHFTGMISAPELARLLATTDLHIYLTAPFVLSWSMMNAMSCGAVVLGSRTAPVQEMIRDGENGLLGDFFDVEELAHKALTVLRDPVAARALGQAAEQQIASHYSLDVIVPRMVTLYEELVARPRPTA